VSLTGVVGFEIALENAVMKLVIRRCLRLL
jgi:hypothetical protein